MLKTSQQFSRFAIIGLVNTSLDFTVYLLLTRLLGVYYLLANLLAFGLANIFSFWANGRWSFVGHGRTDKLKNYGQFFLVSCLAVLLVEGLLYVGHGRWGLPDLTVKVFGLACSVLWSFVAHKYWTFKPSLK